MSYRFQPFELAMASANKVISEPFELDRMHSSSRE